MCASLHVGDHHPLPQVSGHLAQFQHLHGGRLCDHRIALHHHRPEILGRAENPFDGGRGIGKGAGKIIGLKRLNLRADGGIAFEKEVATTVAGAWETLTFDYSAINTARTYQKIVLIFDLGTVGDGSANFTFLFDDITLN